jgi:hypothetical protein
MVSANFPSSALILCGALPFFVEKISSHLVTCSIAAATVQAAHTSCIIKKGTRDERDDRIGGGHSIFCIGLVPVVLDWQQ